MNPQTQQVVALKDYKFTLFGVLSLVPNQLPGVEYEVGNAPQVNFRALLNDTAENLKTLPSTSEKQVGFLALEDDTEALHDIETKDPSTPDQAESEEAERLSKLYPNSIRTSDVKHIVDNMLHECLDSMTM